MKMKVAKTKTLIDIMIFGITTSTQTKDVWGYCDYWIDAITAKACIETCNKKGLGVCVMKFKNI